MTGAEFHVHSGFAGYLDVTRYPAYAYAVVKRFAVAYGYVGTILAAIGAALLVVQRGAFGKALVLAALLAAPYTESYADLQEPDRYYLPALWCGAIAMAIAFELAYDLILNTPQRWLRLAAVGAFVVALGFVSPSRWDIFGRHDVRGAPDYVEYVRSVTPNDAIVLADWAYSTPLAYASYVEHSFGDRIAVAASATQYEESYAGWLAKHDHVYFVSFDDDLHLDGFHVQRLTTDQSFNMYEITR